MAANREVRSNLRVLKGTGDNLEGHIRQICPSAIVAPTLAQPANNQAHYMLIVSQQELDAAGGHKAVLAHILSLCPSAEIGKFAFTQPEAKVQPKSAGQVLRELAKGED